MTASRIGMPIPRLELESIPARDRLAPWHAYLLGTSLLAVLYLAVKPFRGSVPIADLIEICGTVAVFAGVRWHRPRTARAWSCLLLALLLLLGSDLYAYAYPRLHHQPAPFPSAGDALRLAAYPVLAAGLLLLRRRDRTGAGPRLIDSLIMTLGLGLLFWIFLITPYVDGRTLSLLPKIVSIGRPIGDVLVLGAGIRLALEDGARGAAARLLIAAIGCLLVTDFVYGLLISHGSAADQPVLVFGWLCFYALAGAAALHPSMRGFDRPAEPSEAQVTRLRLTLLTGASLIAPVIEVTRELGSGNVELHVTIEASVVLFSLVVMRMAWLVRAREQSFSRERTLTSAGAMLMAATSRDEIAGAALDSVHALIDGDVSARMCLPEDRGMVVFGEGKGSVRSIWTISGRNLVPGLDDGDGAMRLSEAALIQLRLHGLPARAAAFRLRAARAPSGGILIVAGEEATTTGAISALRTLVSQVSLALDSNALADEMHRQESEARISSLVQNASDLITVIDGRAQVVYQSPSIERVLGYQPDEVVGRPFAKLLHPTEKGRLLRRLTSGGAGRSVEPIDCALRHRDGSVRHFEIVPTNLLEDGAVHGIVLNGRDVSERKEFEEQLARQAFHDPVTHLANRALFTERVRHAVARSLREKIGLAVLFMDLDEFKIVNDSLGHAAGDRVLLEVAQRIETSVRGGDTAARFGSDEFAILLEDIDGAQAAAEIAERILDALAQPLRVNGSDVTVRASLGLSVAEPGSPSDADELTRNADAAMYIAKADGAGGYRLFEPAMHELVRARLELRADLQRALGEEQFELYFQPIVRLEDGEAVSVEALLRWNHPVRGIVPPDQFIPFAEESGLIVPIGSWVLHEGCRRLQEIRERTGRLDLTMSVNLSVEQLLRDDIFADLCTALDESRLEPAAVTMEITESVMMSDVELAVERLTELKGLGIKLAMDDFGTGYSSLSYLSRFPIDVLKMDRSLLGAGRSQITSGLTGAVLSLGQTFGAVVVAEGVELPEQCSTLRELGCELGQGFYFAKPMPLDRLTEYLAGDSGERANRSAASQ